MENNYAIPKDPLETCDEVWNLFSNKIVAPEGVKTQKSTKVKLSLTPEEK